MNYQNYKKQVELLLAILPIIGKETCFALHGGTAINLFHSNMPRLSVDIDLTYLPIQDRESSMLGIQEALGHCKNQIEMRIANAQVVFYAKEAKLFISNKEASIKVEVNLIKRGCFNPPTKRILCDKAQEEFDAFCEIQVVDDAHLFGGKICAAIDRQHPRDLFDMNRFFKSNNALSEIKKGFFFYLISSNRPLRELLFPLYKDQKSAFENQFQGMTEEVFTYQDYENTRIQLIDSIHKLITASDKQFLLSIEKGTPNWVSYNFSDFPAVKWKLQNIQQLKNQNPAKHLALCADFDAHLSKLNNNF